MQDFGPGSARGVHDLVILSVTESEKWPTQ